MEPKELDELERDAAIQVAELAHDYNLDSSQEIEELYNQTFKDSKEAKATERFKRPAYYGTGETNDGKINI